MEKLNQCPDWPALMDVDTAILYMGGKKKLLNDLVTAGVISRYTDTHRCVTYRRAEIDRALALTAAASAEKPDPIDQWGRMEETANSLMEELEYLLKKGGSVRVEWFDLEWQPDGPALRRKLLDSNLAEEKGRKVALNSYGRFFASAGK